MREGRREGKMVWKKMERVLLRKIEPWNQTPIKLRHHMRIIITPSCPITALHGHNIIIGSSARVVLYCTVQLHKQTKHDSSLPIYHIPTPKGSISSEFPAKFNWGASPPALDGDGSAGEAATEAF